MDYIYKFYQVKRNVCREEIPKMSGSVDRDSPGDKHKDHFRNLKSNPFSIFFIDHEFNYIQKTFVVSSMNTKPYAENFPSKVPGVKQVLEQGSFIGKRDQALEHEGKGIWPLSDPRCFTWRETFSPLL